MIHPLFSISLWFSLLCLLATTSLNAQSRQPNPANNSGRSTSNQREVAPDTFGVFIFQVANPNEEVTFKDTLLDAFHQYDPTRQGKDDLAHLGLVGSAHEALVFENELRSGFNLGWHAYDRYYVDGHSMPYYRLERPYTNLWFSQGSAQQNNIVKAKFSRNFAQGLNYGLDYQAITQKDPDVQYPNQRNQTKALATGLWWHSSNNRYDGFLSYASNTTNSEDNGGLVTLPQTGGEFSSPTTADVYLNDAQTRHALRELMYTHYYKIGGRVDSTGSVSRAYTLSHQIEYDNNTYRFDDPYTVADDSFYTYFPTYRLDIRGARYFLAERSIANSFKISTFKQAQVQQKGSRQQRDLLELGIRHEYHKIEFEPTDTVINNLLLTAKTGWRPNDKIRLLADAALALADQAGDYHLRVAMHFDMGKAGRFDAYATNRLYSPAYLQNHFWMMQQELWRNDFSKSLHTTLKAVYSLPALQLEIDGQYQLLNDYIYYNQAGMPQQANTAISVLQLGVQKNFTFGPFHLNNRFVFQQSSESQILKLADFVGKHSLYYQGRWFKKVMDVQVGIDLRYTSAFEANYYNPFIGQFILQDRQELDLYPNTDVYFSMAVSKFRAFIKWENATQAFDLPQAYFYTSALSPWPAAGIRFGVNWRMTD